MTARKNPKMSDLTAKQKAAVRCILSCRTLEGAATAAGVDSRTLRRWKESEAFREALQEAQAEATAQTLIRLENALAESIEALRSLLADTEESQVRRAAAAVLLRHGLEAIELRAITARLDELERSLEK